MEVIDSGSHKINLIQKRDTERRLELEKRKENRNKLIAGNEKLDYFEENFTSKQTEIESLLNKSNTIEKHLLPNHFNEISKQILILQKYVANSNLFLRTYDIKRCQQSILELTSKLKELETELLPKKKFGFAKKNKPKIERKVDDTDQVDFQNLTHVRTKEFCGFANKCGESLIMAGDCIYKKDVLAEDLENCEVKFFGAPSTLHLNHLKNCYIFTGPVSTSIFAENCTNCTLVIACQQLRLHASKNVNIYLHVTSRAIMEDCNNILLAPYNLQYDGLENDFEKSGLDQHTNNWNYIDDFNWLNVEKQSPNWALLDEKQIVHTWNIQ